MERDHSGLNSTSSPTVGSFSFALVRYLILQSTAVRGEENDQIIMLLGSGNNKPVYWIWLFIGVRHCGWNFTSVVLWGEHSFLPPFKINIFLEFSRLQKSLKSGLSLSCTNSPFTDCAFTHTHTHLFAELCKSYRCLDTCPLNSSACVLITEFSDMTIIPFSYLRKFERSQYYLINSGYSNFFNCQNISYVVFFTRCCQDSCVIFSSISLSISFNLESLLNLCKFVFDSFINDQIRDFFSFSQCCVLTASHQKAYGIRVLLSMNAEFDCWLRSRLPDLSISVIFETVEIVCSLYLSLHPLMILARIATLRVAKWWFSNYAILSVFIGWYSLL